MLLAFPYQVSPIPPTGTENKVSHIENWLNQHEATISVESTSKENGLSKVVSQARDQMRTLIRLSRTCLRDCLPHLNVGDVFDVLERPALMPSIEGEEKPATQEPSSPAARARQELVDVLGGHAILMSPYVAAEGKGYAPWSLRYSGHQWRNGNCNPIFSLRGFFDPM